VSGGGANSWCRWLQKPAVVAIGQQTVDRRFVFGKVGASPVSRTAVQREDAGCRKRDRVVGAVVRGRRS
jgi:hypothetical protein